MYIFMMLAAIKLWSLTHHNESKNSVAEAALLAVAALLLRSFLQQKLPSVNTYNNQHLL
jgi:hypothetical protein